MDAKDFKPGLYRHYKGGLYTAICLVTHHETREPMVLYVSHTYGGMNVRPLNGWSVSGGNNRCEDLDGFADLVEITCPDCRGNGWVSEPRGVGGRQGCTQCAGSGSVPSAQRRFEFVGPLPSNTKIEER